MPNGFLPVYDSECTTLILGSFPSVKSREVDFYYGNPQNRFWRILANIFQQEVGDTPAQKTAFLLAHHLALWDVVAQCAIKGSMDTAIKNPILAPLTELISKTKIVRIICNGQKSFALLQKGFPALIPLAILCPSTSPANPRCDPAVWQNALKPR